MADMVTLDGRRITSKGITSGAGFRVPPLADATCRFGSTGHAQAPNPEDLQQQVSHTSCMWSHHPANVCNI